MERVHGPISFIFHAIIRPVPLSRCSWLCTAVRKTQITLPRVLASMYWPINTTSWYSTHNRPAEITSPGVGTGLSVRTRCATAANPPFLLLWLITSHRNMPSTQVVYLSPVYRRAPPWLALLGLSLLTTFQPFLSTTPGNNKTPLTSCTPPIPYVRGWPAPQNNGS